ncbi:MAG: sulfurtransferase, partial [Herminiimonas sp.]|nr:sulfurtransferase [Herminiimonas sp.]
MHSDTYVNIAAYKFITFDDTAEKRAAFRELCSALELKGTIMLSPEGINLFLAGLREPIDRFLTWLREDPR